MDRTETVDETVDTIVKNMYLEKSREVRRDFTRFIPWNVVVSFPRQGSEGLYGWTIRGEGKIHLREDLQEEKRVETTIHESIHTPDEYETRRLTEWIMQGLFPRQEQYRTKPPTYQC